MYHTSHNTIDIVTTNNCHYHALKSDMSRVITTLVAHKLSYECYDQLSNYHIYHLLTLMIRPHGRTIVEIIVWYKLMNVSR